MNAITKTTLQVNKVEDLEQVLKSCPEITINLSNKVTNKLSKQLSLNFAESVNEALSQIFNERGDDDCAIKLDRDDNGKIKFVLSSGAIREMRRQIRENIRSVISSSLRQESYSQMLQVYREVCDEMCKSITGNAEDMERIKSDAKESLKKFIAQKLTKELIGLVNQ